MCTFFFMYPKIDGDSVRFLGNESNIKKKRTKMTDMLSYIFLSTGKFISKFNILRLDNSLLSSEFSKIFVKEK